MIFRGLILMLAGYSVCCNAGAVEKTLGPVVAVSRTFALSEAECSKVFSEKPVDSGVPRPKNACRIIVGSPQPNEILIKGASITLGRPQNIMCDTVITSDEISYTITFPKGGIGGGVGGGPENLDRCVRDLFKSGSAVFQVKVESLIFSYR